jgi:uncharacterized Tic20 family protein
MNYFLRLITGKPSFTSGVLALSGILMIAFVFHYASKHKDEIIPEYSVEEEEKRVLIYPSRISFILYCIYLLIILIGIYVMCIGISQAELKIAILLSLIGLFSIKITIQFVLDLFYCITTGVKEIHLFEGSIMLLQYFGRKVEYALGEIESIDVIRFPNSFEFPLILKARDRREYRLNVYESQELLSKLAYRNCNIKISPTARDFVPKWK